MISFSSNAIFLGVLCLLLQLLFADVFSLSLCFFDVFTSISNKWIFGSEMCNIFIILSSFISTASTYLILTANFHAISTSNLALNVAHVIRSKDEKNKFLDEEFDSFSSTYDVLEHKRTLTIDYSSGSEWKGKVKIFKPSLIVFLIAFFISIPSFVFSLDTINISKLCIPKRFSYDEFSILALSEITMISIKTFIPVLLIAWTSIVGFNKIKILKNVKENFTEENPRKILKFSCIIGILFLLFQAQKIVIDAIQLILRNLDLGIAKVAIDMLYYFGITVRLVASRILLRKLK